jgi:hypothetical protein
MYRDITELLDDNAPWSQPIDNRTEIPMSSTNNIDERNNTARGQAE